METAAVSEVTNPLNYLGRTAFRLGTVRLLDVFRQDGLLKAVNIIKLLNFFFHPNYLNWGKLAASGF